MQRNTYGHPKKESSARNGPRGKNRKNKKVPKGTYGMSRQHTITRTVWKECQGRRENEVSIARRNTTVESERECSHVAPSLRVQAKVESLVVKQNIVAAGCPSILVRYHDLR